MGLLAEIQNDAISDSIPLATLLRKCMLLAHKLDSELLEDWVRWELNGYPNDVEVPDYRQLAMRFKVSAYNIAWRVTDQPIAPALINNMVGKDDFHILKFRKAIGTINVDEIKNGNGALQVNLDNYALLLPGKVIDEDFNVASFWGEVGSSQVLGIVEAVRNRVLEFALALQKKYPDAGEVGAPTAKEPTMEQVVNQIFNTTINGNAGIVGSANQSTVNITVNQGNFQDLRQQLIQHGVTEADVQELEKAVALEPQIGTDKKFGPKVTKWIGGMVGKAASGVWGVGLAAGGALLEKALLGYYGYS